MQKILFAALAAAAIALPAQGQQVQSAWVQYAPNGAVEARAVVAGDACPAIAIDGAQSPMRLRAAGDAIFPTVCSAPVPKGAKAVSLDGHALPVPVADPTRILVMGDTGCRIKGKELQACNDPKKWPFPEMAKEEARLKPDLVIDVGDYLYRENACPAGFAGCTDTPHGDNWPTWDADFFAPAAPLLGAAPWVLVRGNHEDCERAGKGWLRILGPQAYDPNAACVPHLAPYSVPMGPINLVVMDDANAPDTSIAADMVPVYRSEIAALANAPAPSWLLMHRPIWGAVSGPLNVPVGGNQTLIKAIGSTGIPSPVALMLSGHIHTFEAMNYGPHDHVPPQIVAGFGGDKLDPTPWKLTGTIFQGDSGVNVKDGLSLPGFGFLMMRKVADGWDVDVHNVNGKIERRCWFRAGHVGCAKPR
ncbi:MAG: metallophosphoesterase [Alphaproteobacteria bacterium]|nr:metallophosphoesterase [Alphaproteobacteria bacterium]MDE1986817.1 metallophosphoesterase [Alphaproteobacteria bacterium]MDE2500303.1 metallophosphoesterase [Alphaproteobacteria bacterium]